MAREQFLYKSSRLIRAVAPVDKSVLGTPNPLTNADDGTTASFQVYKGSKSSALALGGQNDIVVEGSIPFIVGEMLLAKLEDGTDFSSVITAIDDATKAITVTDSLNADLWAGQHVRVAIGSPVTMTVEYGTADATKKNWGFQGTYPEDHASQIPGLDIDIVVTVVGAPGGGLDGVKTICATIVEECDIAA